MAWSTEEVSVGGSTVSVRVAGAGAPLVLFHDELGVPAAQPWLERLAQQRQLFMPIIPGFVGERLAWVRGTRDLAPLMGAVLRDMIATPFDAVGISFGGWLAAEMAVQNPAQFSALALIAPFGLKPDEGYIADMFVMSSAEYIRAGFVDPDGTPAFKDLYSDVPPETIEAWEDARIESARLGWQPYMHTPAMPELLPCAGQLPVQVIWGDRDVILPEAAARAYADGFSGGRLERISGCGHRPELERPDEVVRLVESFHARQDQHEPA